MNLSYILSTKNKLPYLKIILPEIISQKKENEQIIVIDADSTDGAKKYLQALLSSGKIQKLVSEPDAGESHGINKALFLTEGEFIKIITDDDLFSATEIEKCRVYMKSNPKIDILFSNGGKATLLSKNMSEFQYESLYNNWKATNTPIAFCGLGIMIRKSSLPLLGLFSTAHIRADAEYTLRISSNKKVNLAFYSGITFVHVANKNSNTNTMSGKFHNETKILEKIYKWNTNVSLSKKIQNSLKNIFNKKTPQSEDFSNIEESYEFYRKWLKNKSDSSEGVFISKN